MANAAHRSSSPKSSAPKTRAPKTKDPKTIVTPFAFHVAPELLYTPLASPLKRGLAMLIDALLISVLAEQAGGLFILLVGLTLVIERRSHQLGKALKWGLYLAMLLMTIWVTSDNIISYGEGDKADAGSKPAQTTGLQADSLETLKIMPQILSFSLCEEAGCADEKLTTLFGALDTLKASDSEKVALVSQLITELSLSDQEKAVLMQRLTQGYPNITPVSKPGMSNPSMSTEANLATSAAAPNEEPAAGTKPDHQEIADKITPLVIDADRLDEEDKPSPYSLLEWAKGILNDLGLGFGWAAFYFTVFTAWFDGQTLGKKLLNIRVVPLDASRITLWDAFGRYGGYGAGFATGLLGFLQIFWDANRQAIQDKISETVVVDLSKPREVPVEERSTEVYGGA
ncbi:RDD family protein [Shewanella sp. Isolate8]|uniref:RDD family protein n=1 Tax=Shewanella sp. Isolate8 TaxID=2908529 RepID=UPI001EFD74E5|nr:RDD family protein [Shewanella sp. Isolate8]MCG9746894.1 RDD family protein [Shewanella sp. Isolate8]